MKPSLGTMSVKPIIEHKGSPWHSVPYATYAFNAKQSESTIKLKYGDLEILLKDGKLQFISKGGAIISNIKEIIFMNSKIRGITDDITSIPPEEQRYYALNAFPKILKIGKYDLNESFITNFLNDISNKVDKLTFKNEVKQINDELNHKADINHTHPYFELLRVDKLLIINHLRIRNHNILEFIYPIGSIYTSMNNTNPYDLFQFGVWSQITDRFLYCANSSKQKGGSKKITVENLPQHNHNCMWQDINSGGFKAGKMADGNKWSTELVFDDKNSFIHTDDNPEFKNTDYMPPYITVYAWYREA